MKPKRLYDFPFSGNGYKVRLALAQLGIPVDYSIVDLIKRETQSPSFLTTNRLGQIPVLEMDDGTMLRESNAILYWLTEGSYLMPLDKLGRTRVVQWMNFEQSNIDKVLGRARFLKRYPQFQSMVHVDFNGWYSTGYRALDMVEEELGGHAFMVGDSYSAADICLYGYVHCAEDGGFSFDRYPRVRRWLTEVKNQARHIEISVLPAAAVPP